MRKSAHQRIVSAALAIVFLPGSFVSAGIRHSHSEADETLDHDARPHVHVGCAGHAHYSHGSGHSHHHHADGTHSPVTDKGSEEQQDGHDRDAIYLANDISNSLLTKSVHLLDGGKVISTLATESDLPATCSVNASERAYFSGECSPARPLYLALRALRI